MRHAKAELILIEPPERPPIAPNRRLFYDAIGRFVLVWGRFEQHLENLERIALNLLSESAPERPMMITLAKKLDALVDLFEAVPALKPDKPDMEILARLAKDLGDLRHRVVHSNLSGFEEGEPDRIHLHFVTHKRGDMAIESFKPSVSDIELMINQTLDLHRQLLFPMLERAVTYQSPEMQRKAQSLGQSADGHRRTIRL